MKKLVLMMIIAAIVMLPAIASADGISGKYKMIASGSCIHSQNGYDVASNGWITAKPGIVYAGTTTWRGTWNFYRDMSGTYSNKFCATVTPSANVNGGIRIFAPPLVEFTYEFNSETNEITVNDGSAVYKGDVSADANVITLLEDNHVIRGPNPAPYWYITCNTSRTLIYVGDPDP